MTPLVLNNRALKYKSYELNFKLSSKWILTKSPNLGKYVGFFHGTVRGGGGGGEWSGDLEGVQCSCGYTQRIGLLHH